MGVTMSVTSGLRKVLGKEIDIDEVKAKIIDSLAEAKKGLEKLANASEEYKDSFNDLIWYIDLVRDDLNALVPLLKSYLKEKEIEEEF